jgi:predicted dithiol-disulfide oxidoreductase (DUF899 family)
MRRQRTGALPKIVSAGQWQAAHEKLLAKEKAVTRARHVPCAVSRAPLRNTLRYQKRMGWTVPWFSSAPSAFNVDFGVARQKGETFGLSVFLRDGRRVAPISPRSAAWRR